MCQCCENNPSTCLSANHKEGIFEFICTGCQNNNQEYWYWIDFNTIKKNDDWLRHLREKIWFNESMEKSFISKRNYILKK